MKNYLNENGFLTYKGRPLVRNKDIIYYGNINDEYVAMIKILTKETNDTKETKETKENQNNFEIANKLSVFLMATDTSIDVTKSIIKKSEKPNLYEALDIADIWLTRILI